MENLMVVLGKENEEILEMGGSGGHTIIQMY